MGRIQVFFSKCCLNAKQNDVVGFFIRTIFLKEFVISVILSRQRSNTSIPVQAKPSKIGYNFFFNYFLFFLVNFYFRLYD